MFEMLLGIKEIPEGYGVITRNTIKAVCYNEKGELLMMYTNKGDYKFPGGGTKKNETTEQTLKREIREETGFTLESVGELLGTTVERRPDIKEKNTIFEIDSTYLECSINCERQRKQKNLDKYEKEQQIVPVFVTIEEAIKANEKVLSVGSDVNAWVKRDYEVLKQLLKERHHDM